MPDITVIADTSCLIALTKIEALELLKELYKEVYNTEEIMLEYGERLPAWIIIKNVKNKRYQQLLHRSLTWVKHLQLLCHLKWMMFY